MSKEKSIDPEIKKEIIFVQGSQSGNSTSENVKKAQEVVDKLKEK